jgi:hypothetical protein
MSKFYQLCESKVEIITKYLIFNLTVGHTYQTTFSEANRKYNPSMNATPYGVEPWARYVFSIDI